MQPKFSFMLKCTFIRQKNFLKRIRINICLFNLRSPYSRLYRRLNKTKTIQFHVSNYFLARCRPFHRLKGFSDLITLSFLELLACKSPALQDCTSTTAGQEQRSEPMSAGRSQSLREEKSHFLLGIAGSGFFQRKCVFRQEWQRSSLRKERVWEVFT